MANGVTDWLWEAARACPAKTAFSDSSETVTYGELARQAASAAKKIRRMLDGEKRLPVGVLIGRNAASVTAFLAVAAAGCFYVPLDPALPEKRLRGILGVVKPRLILDASGKVPAAVQGYAVAPLSELTGGEAEYPADAGIMDSDPLYCIFTSGSTGIPKGVLISHRSVINMARAFSAVLPIDESSVFGNQAPFDFDVSVKDIYLTLYHRARTVILEKSLFSIPKRLMEVLNRERVNTLVWSVSAMKILSALRTFRSAYPEHARLIMFSGEALPARILGEWQDVLPDAQYVNLYGPTEITCNCAYYRVNRRFADGEPIPVGKPFDNMNVFLLSPGGESPVTQPGEVGEICVTGAGLALGYYAEPEKTARAFVTNPLTKGWDERMYRTGDLAKYDADGNLVFVGRADSQVKYMGFRIELGEIETAAQSVPFVQSACCLFDERREELWLFYQADGQNDAALLTALREKLPSHMIPRRVRYFEILPQNRTGKPDRGLLRQTYLT